MTEHVNIQGSQSSISPESGSFPATHTPRGEAKLTTPTGNAPPPAPTLVCVPDDTYDDTSDDDGTEGQLNISTSSERPEGWVTGAFSGLKRIVAEAKGAASKPVVDFIRK